MYIYTYIYTYICIYTYTRTHIRIFIYIYIFIDALFGILFAEGRCQATKSHYTKRAPRRIPNLQPS